MQNLPKAAKVVIIGGGVIGASTAYHLSLHPSFRDTILLEQGSLTCGTTWHAAGLIGQMRSTSAEITLSKYGCELLDSLEDQGYATGWQRCGSLSLSSCDERMVHLKRNLSRARAFNIEAELLSAEEAFGKWPYFDKKDINGALWLPNDGSAVSTDVTMALSQAAKKNGVRIFENTQVTKLLTSSSLSSNLQTVTGVEVNGSSSIQADVVVMCTGLWSPHIHDSLVIPLQPCYHMYVISEACGILKDLPVLRDLDGLIYAREWSGGLCVGGFELKAKPCFVGEKPGKLEYHLFPEDWDHFDPILKNAMNRFPFMRSSGIRQFINGPESFTIDNAYIMGEAPEIKNLFVSTGFNSSGIASSGGAGLALSEMIVNGGKTVRDLWTVDTRRFAPFMKNSRFLQERVSETLGFHYSIPWPLRDFQTGRGIRRSALYDRLKAKGGYFGTKFGWERVNVFLEKGFDMEKAMRSWILNEELSARIRREHTNTRENVSLFDQTSFAKYLVQGEEAKTLLQYLLCNNLDVPVNKIVYTGMLNEEGGYEADITATRLSNTEYLLVSSSGSATRDLLWIRKHIQEKQFKASVTDVTSAYSILGLMGPKSRDLLNAVIEENKEDVTNTALPFGHSKEIAFGMARVRVNRISYVGTLGFELVVPTEMTSYVYELLEEKGPAFGLMDAGYYALESLRIEKGNRAWGVELKSTVNPLEAGLNFTVDWKKPDFIGKKALLEMKQGAKGIKKKIMSFSFDDLEEKVILLGDEPIYRNKELVGYVTAIKFGYSVGKWVCLGSLQNGEVMNKEWVEKGEFEIEVIGERKRVKAHLKGVWDPENKEIFK